MYILFDAHKVACLLRKYLMLQIFVETVHYNMSHIPLVDCKVILLFDRQEG